MAKSKNEDDTQPHGLGDVTQTRKKPVLRLGREREHIDGTYRIDMQQILVPEVRYLAGQVIAKLFSIFGRFRSWRK
jgi:hypothetical protein